MAPTLYMIAPSPPVRSVRILAKTIGLELNLKEVNLFNKEHLTPEYLKINPQHTVPTLVEEDGFTVWDSHAIMIYLLTKYGKDDTLFPTDPKQRAIINQRLHFESGVAFPRLVQTLRPILFFGKKTIDDSAKDNIIDTYKLMETFLEGKEWIAGNFITLADISLITTITTTNILVPIDSVQFPKVTAWVKKCEALPSYEISKKGLEDLKELVKSHLS